MGISRIGRFAPLLRPDADEAPLGFSVIGLKRAASSAAVYEEAPAAVLPPTERDARVFDMAAVGRRPASAAGRRPASAAGRRPASAAPQRPRDGPPPAGGHRQEYVPAERAASPRDGSDPPRFDAGAGALDATARALPRRIKISVPGMRLPDARAVPASPAFCLSPGGHVASSPDLRAATREALWLPPSPHERREPAAVARRAKPSRRPSAKKRDAAARAPADDGAGAPLARLVLDHDDDGVRPDGDDDDACAAPRVAPQPMATRSAASRERAALEAAVAGLPPGLHVAVVGACSTALFRPNAATVVIRTPRANFVVARSERLHPRAVAHALCAHEWLRHLVLRNNATGCGDAAALAPAALKRAARGIGPIDGLRARDAVARAVAAGFGSSKAWRVSGSAPPGRRAEVRAAQRRAAAASQALAAAEERLNCVVHAGDGSGLRKFAVAPSLPHIVAYLAALARVAARHTGDADDGKALFRALVAATHARLDEATPPPPLSALGAAWADAPTPTSRPPHASQRRRPGSPLSSTSVGLSPDRRRV
ncbi:hypothetical protein M885DRAFT_590148 [Pelagophyceae sp. CCMP2097]|nr:hypothetical protein M885DRAFT_590148 [Pelagophyceae sp. CCMP2097]